MLDLINTYQNEIIHFYSLGFILSLFVRFSIITSCIYISNNTRLKELKNLTNRVATKSLKRAYISLLWPYELIHHIVHNTRYFLKK
jgi:hypothetical protein